MICAFFGCVCSGMIPTPIAAPSRSNPQAGLLRMQQVTRDCRPIAVLSTTEVADTLQRRLTSSTDQLRSSLSDVANLPWIASDAFTEPLGRATISPPSPILFLQYTSGSTSQPKGVMVSHDNVLANARLVLDHDDPVAVSWLPQHHDMGLIGFYINTALAGGTLYGFSPASFIQKPALWFQTISRVRATASSAPNFAFELCLRPGRIPDAVRSDLDLGSLRFLMAAAEPVNPGMYREFLQAFEPCGLRPESFVVAYGLAEHTLAVSSHGRHMLSVSRTALTNDQVHPTTAVSGVSDSRHIMSCGRPLGDTNVRIVDPVTTRESLSGRVGEIWVAGTSKCLGYWNKERVNWDTFEAEVAGDPQPRRRYLRTGDIGFVHEGELYLCGRLKDMINVRGQNYYPQDIELAAEQVEGVRKSGTVAFEVSSDAGRSEIALAVEVVSRNVLFDPRSIASAVRSSVGLEVDRIALVAPLALPRTTSGKLMRFRARQIWQEGGFATISEYRRSCAADLLTATSVPSRCTALGYFKTKYRLMGDETLRLADAGLDSLDLVLFLHELSELLIERGAGELAQAIDIDLIQHMSVAELFRLAAGSELAPETSHANFSQTLALAGDQCRAKVLGTMSSDRRLKFESVPPVGDIWPHPQTKALVTGATGFFGPFLLMSFLSLTTKRICCLVRGRNPDHARERLCAALVHAGPQDPKFWRSFDERVEVVCGDLAKSKLGLSDQDWKRLSRETDTIFHNGADVNYLFSYDRLRAANVRGTNETVRLAFEGRAKTFNHISTTFIFGWATKDILREADANEDMEHLDFGYSQSKWVAEQIVHDGIRQGLEARIFRPALITPSTSGAGGGLDITLRLLAFMIKHGIGVSALNQVSFVPADLAANNVVAIANLPQTAPAVYHVTRDDFACMSDITDIIACLTGRRFQLFDLPYFVREVIHRCTRDDLIFPLLDFLVGSIDNISAMEFKRYDNSNYREARRAAPFAWPDPPLAEVVAGMLLYLRRTRIIEGCA